MKKNLKGFCERLFLAFLSQQTLSDELYLKAHLCPGAGTSIYADTGCAFFWGAFLRAEDKFWSIILGKIISSHKFWGVILEK